MKSFRPVSNLPYISKLIEKVAVKQLEKHMENNQLYEPNQSAYRSCHSTETALLRITNDCLCAMDDNRCMLLVMLDLSAAFDTVSHSILIRRMEKMYGLTGDVLKWMQSYFSDRKQSIIIDGVVSSAKHLKTGLPQGSRLGPFAFPLYSAPLFEIARQHGITMHMYADDTQLYLSFKLQDYDWAITKMEHCLVDIRQWMSQNQLKLNDSKTEFMVIGKKASVNKLPKDKIIQIGDDRIKASDKARNIGVVLDTHLDMKSQINSVCRSAYMHIHNIGKIRSCLTQEATATLIHALVTSKLDNYNSLIFGCPDASIKKLQMVQHSAARLIMQIKIRDHITPILMELHWLPVKARITYKLCLLVFKCLNQIAPLYLQDLVTLYQPRRQGLRSEDLHHQLQPPNNIKQKWAGERSFIYAAAHLWNALPQDLVLSETCSIFKSRLKKYLFKDSYQSYL